MGYVFGTTLGFVFVDCFVVYDCDFSVILLLWLWFVVVGVLLVIVVVMCLVFDVFRFWLVLAVGCVLWRLVCGFAV